MLSKKLDQQLLDLAWSLWTELGVAGVIQKHQNYLVLPEELVILTSTLSEHDPRLRDEALDWCSRFHHLISAWRLRTIGKMCDEKVQHDLSVFTTTLNMNAGTNWPVLIKAPALKFHPSGKSKSPNFEKPSMLAFRLRSFFGVGARADILTFCLMNQQRDYSISDFIHIGYTKRNIANVMEELTHAGIFKNFPVLNQIKYRFVKQEQMTKIIEPLSKRFFSWQLFLEVILSLRACILKVETKSDTTKAIEIHNLLLSLKDTLDLIQLTPIPMHKNFTKYWQEFSEWVLNIFPH